MKDKLISLNEVRVSDEITQSLLNFEPRISDVKVTTSIYSESNELNCTVQYDIVGIPAPTQQVDVLLFPARV